MTDFVLFKNRVAGTAGAVVTCPLEVVKTRLQSSNPVFGNSDNAKPFYANNNVRGRSNLPSSSSSSSHSQRYQHHTLSTDRGHIRSRFQGLSTCVNCGRNSYMLNHVARSIPPNASPITNNVPNKLGLGLCLR